MNYRSQADTEWVGGKCLSMNMLAYSLWLNLKAKGLMIDIHRVVLHTPPTSPAVEANDMSVCMANILTHGMI